MCLQQCITVKISTGVFKKISLFVMPPPLGAGGIMFLGCPSVRQSEAWNTLFWPVHGSVGWPDQPWPFYGMSLRPSIRPERFPGICGRTHGGNGLKFYMLMCLDHLQNWLVYGHSLLIFSCDQAALQMVFSVRLSVRLSHLFDYFLIIASSWNFQKLLPMTKVRSMQKVKVRG